LPYKDTADIILMKGRWRAEMINCKYCGSEALMKKGITRGKQRYYCKSCERRQVEGDERERYPEIVRKTAKILYLEGGG
jgi:transposase-like protein